MLHRQSWLCRDGRIRETCWTHPPAVQGLSQQIPLGNLATSFETHDCPGSDAQAGEVTVKSELWGKGGFRKGGGTP